MDYPGSAGLVHARSRATTMAIGAIGHSNLE